MGTRSFALSAEGWAAKNQDQANRSMESEIMRQKGRQPLGEGQKPQINGLLRLELQVCQYIKSGTKDKIKVTCKEEDAIKLTRQFWK